MNHNNGPGGGGGGDSYYHNLHHHDYGTTATTPSYVSTSSTSTTPPMSNTTSTATASVAHHTNTNTSFASATEELKQYLSIPPSPQMELNNQNNSNPMAVAHAALEALRHEGDARFLFLRTILEQTSTISISSTISSTATATATATAVVLDEELLFHCITGCRQVLLWHWSSTLSSRSSSSSTRRQPQRFSRAFVVTVRDYFMVLGCALGRRSPGPNHNNASGGASGGIAAANACSSGASRVVRMACFTASVALWKRGWNDENDENEHDEGSDRIAQQEQQQPSPDEQSLILAMQNSLQLPNSSSSGRSGKEQLFAYIEALLLPQQPSQSQSSSHGSYHQQQQQHAASVLDGCSLLSALVTEFAAKSSTISYRVSLEFHQQVHQSFEKQHGALTTSLRLVLTALSHVVAELSQHQQQQPTQEVAASREEGQLVALLLERANAVVTCTIDVLSWEFGLAAWDAGKLTGDAAAAAGGTTGRRALIRPPVVWREYIMPSSSSSSGGGGTDLLRALTVLHSNCIQRKLQQQQHPLSTSTTTSSSSSTYYSWNQQLARNLRQLLILLASLSGPIFQNPQERHDYAAFLVEASWQLLQQQQQANAYSVSLSSGELILDTLQFISSIVANFMLSILSQIPATVPLFQAVTAMGIQLLQDQVRDLEMAGGDVDAIFVVNGGGGGGDDNDADDALSFEGRQEALNILLDFVVLLSSDPWLLYSGTESSRQQARQQLSTLLGRPLYQAFCTCRIKMAAMEEHYLVRCETELDEVREDISAALLEDEVESISAVGRLHVPAAMDCLSTLHAQTMPRLQALWAATGGEAIAHNSSSSQPMLTPENAALLEEARLLILFISQLLTDDNEGEAPAIPQAVLDACEQQEPQQAEASLILTRNITSAVEALLQVADVQVHRMAENPSNVLLSPILATTFLTFLQRWAPAYLYPMGYANSSSTNPIVHAWSTREKAQQVVTFCLSLCLYYQCYWPHEKQVQEGAARLLLLMARRGGPLRACIVASPVFLEIVKFHCLTAGIRHLAPQSEFEAIVQTKWATCITASSAAAAAAAAPPTLQSMNMIWGYQRLPYQEKARILTVILVACSDGSDAMATGLLTDALTAIHDAFGWLLRVLDGREVGHNDDINTREMTILCLEMFCGVAAAEASSFEASSSSQECILPQFITPHLRSLAGLMRLYATDLTVCETLLRFFCSYTEQFVAILNRDQSMELFNASAELLRCYSVNHCANRRVVVAARSENDISGEEEQAYNDILCAIQLLINLGTKDFIDACSSNQQGVDSSQVTDVIFLGLQQILPLMTQGLLQFPTLCLRFFDLVGFMADTYPEKVCQLPYDLFDSLLQALLFGMTHHNPNVATVSLHGLASIAREHLQTQRHQQQHPSVGSAGTVVAAAAALDRYLAVRPDLLEHCIRQVLTQVVFRPVVLDRVEAAGMAVLPLAAAAASSTADGLGRVVRELSVAIPTTPEQQQRLQQAFSDLFLPDRLTKAASTGYEGRMNRVLFKAAFEEFVNQVYSFLVVK